MIVLHLIEILSVRLWVLTHSLTHSLTYSLSGGYTAVTVIDLVICIQFFFIATAWVFCTNKYPKKETSDGEAVEDAQHKSKSGSKSKGHKTKSKPLPQIDDDDII